MSNSDEEYLEKNARSILEPLVNSVLRDQPQDVFLYMLQYLQKLQGKNIIHNNMEKEELNNLRKEMKKIGKLAKENNEDEDREDALSRKSSENEENDKVDEMINKRKKDAVVSRQRIGVSAEVYGKFNKKEEFKARVISKTDDQKKRITERIMMSFLFNSLDEKDIHTVIDAMEEVRKKAGENVITEGEKGDVLYLIESGQLDCFKTFVILS